MGSGNHSRMEAFKKMMEMRKRADQKRDRETEGHQDRSGSRQADHRGGHTRGRKPPASGHDRPERKDHPSKSNEKNSLRIENHPSGVIQLKGKKEAVENARKAIESYRRIRSTDRSRNTEKKPGSDKKRSSDKVDSEKSRASENKPEPSPTAPGSELWSYI